MITVRLAVLHSPQNVLLNPHNTLTDLLPPDFPDKDPKRSYTARLGSALSCGPHISSKQPEPLNANLLCILCISLRSHTNYATREGLTCPVLTELLRGRMTWVRVVWRPVHHLLHQVRTGRCGRQSTLYVPWTWHLGVLSICRTVSMRLALGLGWITSLCPKEDSSPGGGLCWLLLSCAYLFSVRPDLWCVPGPSAILYAVHSDLSGLSRG